MAGRLTRRQFVSATGGLAAGALALSNRPAWASKPATLALAARPPATDQVAATYYQLLLRHTRWAESQWDATAGHYATANFSFAVVLGNAVLLTYGSYDESLAGIDEATLRAHTLATISHFAGSNVLTGGSEWGETMFFDSTFELYFVLAAKLLWAELDAATQSNVDTIAAGQAAYTAAVGTANDPRSPGWTPNGLAGGWEGDTKVDEMAVYAQCYGPAVAWLPDHPSAPSWLAQLNGWLLNDTGLPPADQANPTVVAGRPIAAWNTAHNIFDTFLVENHGSFEPHYQLETWRMSARIAAHFLVAGRPVPTAALAKPNGERLWQTIRRVQSNSGEPFMPMIGDRYHLFGRDVIPLAFLAQILGDRDAARAEANMAAQLGPYQLYPPEYQLTKFSGEAKYEPEARAELAISYLFHVWRGQQHGQPVVPVSDAEFFAAASAATDHGPTPGLLAQNTPLAFAATVSKPGFVKCVYAPNHDDWLFDVSDTTPSLLPSTGATVESRCAVAYSALRDGFDATASLLKLSTGHAGFATLPTGAVVYATSGTGAGEGTLQVFNLDMPGIPGLTGTRRYAGADGAVELGQDDAANGGAVSLTFATVSARYLRFVGARPATQYGYSIYELSVYGPAADTDLAVGKPTTASSFTPAYPPGDATDGDSSTRWAVAVADRGVADSWLQVDLGSQTELDRVGIVWEAAYGAAYAIQTSVDATTWTTAVAVPRTHTFGGNWLNVDGRAGFVVRGSDNPITVTGASITLSDGPATGAAGMVIEGYPAQTPATTGAKAAAAAPSGGPVALAASQAEGYLSLFNLGDTAIAGAPLTVAQQAGTRTIYLGTQTITDTGIVYQVGLPAAAAQVLGPQFILTGRGPVAGLVVVATDSQHVSITAPHGHPGCVVTIAPASDRGHAQTTVVGPGQTSRLSYPAVALRPTPDLALGATTYPTSPLPPGMTDPGNAVDGDPKTSWRPGPAGRIVVDLGSTCQLGTLTLRWTGRQVPAVTVSTSADGLTFQQVATGAQGGSPVAIMPLSTSARYLAVAVTNWPEDGASLASLSLTS